MSRPFSKEDIQKFWLDEIERASKRKEEWRQDYQVSDCYDAFLGNQMPGSGGWRYGQQGGSNYAPEDWFTLNLVFANIHAQIPSLYFQNPYFSMNLKRSYHPSPEMIIEMEADMKVREGVLNYLVEENDLVTTGQLCILDAYFQFGVLESKYVPKFERNPDAGKTAKNSDGDDMMDSDGNPVVEEEDMLIAEQFVWSRVNPNHILVNADAGCNEFSWIAKRVTDFVDNVRDNPRFSNTSEKDLEPDAILSDFDNEEADASSGFMAKLGNKRRKKKIKEAPANSQLVTYWKIHDLSRNKVWVIATNGKKPLLEADMPEGIEGHPYSFLKFNDNPDTDGTECWYPIPEVFNQLGPQREYNMACNDVAIHRKRYRRKYGSYHGLLDEDEAVKFEDPEDGNVVTFNHADWQAKFAPIQDAHLDPAVVFDRQQLRTDFADIAGSGPDSAIGGKSDTATEAQINSNKLQIRESDKQNRIRQFLLTGAKKMHQIISAGLTVPSAVQIVGPEGQNWVAFGPENFGEIQGEFKFDLDVLTMAPRNPQVERAQWMQFIQTVLQAPMVFNDPDVLKKWGEMFDIQDNSMLENLAKKLGEMAQQAQQNQGLLPNMPGGGNTPSSIGNILSAQGGAK